MKNKFENLSLHPAGEACAAFTHNSLIAVYKNYEYVDESEEPLCDDELADGLDGFYTVVVVKDKTTDECFKGYVRCIEGQKPTCVSVKTTKC